MTDAAGVARVETKAGRRPLRVEALAPGLAVTHGEAQVAPDFDHGDDEDYIEWPGLEGLEFTVRLGPTKGRP